MSLPPQPPRRVRSLRARFSDAVAPGERNPRPALFSANPDEVTPATRQETFPVALAAVVLGFLAITVCITKGYVLLYGDAVAHLGIARRLVDSRNPGLSQLGGVWLPLPHLLMLPFIGHMDWWQNGMAGAWPSLLCYVLGVAGFYRLARRMLVPRWAFAATTFYALNPNLLYLATTAMTEPLFLALFLWLTLLLLEAVDAIKLAAPAPASRNERPNARANARPASQKLGFLSSRLIFLGLLIFAAVFTRYDGWILGAIVWLVVAWHLYRNPAVRRRVTPAFAIFTLLAVAGPILWLAYNQHFMHDALDFMRGPYSAPAIERKTSPPGAKHYRGWHNPGWALLFYTRTAQVDTSAWETGFTVLLAAVAGLWIAVRRRFNLAAAVLWMPIPFYVYSIAYGSIPIFIPQLYPHSYYNARYGMEMLPALALFFFLAAAALEQHLKASGNPASPSSVAEPPAASWQPLVSRLLHPVLLALACLNAVVMMYRTPLVLKEGIVNAATRIPFERSIAQMIDTFPPGVPILMYTSEHIGALQDAGLNLRQTLNESDYDTWHAALLDPAGHASYVIAIAGDPVSAAVAAHPEGLKELTILCTTGQPCARVYESERLRPNQ